MFPQNELLSMEDKSLIWVSSFGDSGLKEFTVKFIEAEKDPSVSIIHVVISSYGGSAHNMMAMRDLIKSSNKRVATVAYGKAMSAGAFLLAAGTKGLRFASASTSIMLHEVSSGAAGKLNDMQISIEELSRMNTLVMRNFSEDTGKAFKFWESKMKKRANGDLFLSPEDAKSLGIIDHIGYPRMETAQFATQTNLVTYEKKLKK